MTSTRRSPTGRKKSAGRGLKGDFTLENVLRKPSDQGRMVLTGKDQDILLEAIANPPAPTAKLVAALKRHRRNSDDR